MIVHLGRDDARDDARVEEGDDCTRLHVATALSLAETDAALRRSGLGQVDGDDALLSVDGLHDRAAKQATSADWPARWTAMLGYAERKGWLSADGTLVQAHIEPA